jgi:hypothetical protein
MKGSIRANFHLEILSIQQISIEPNLSEEWTLPLPLVPVILTQGVLSLALACFGDIGSRGIASMPTLDPFIKG